MNRKYSILITFILLLAPAVIHADATLVPDTVQINKAQVIQVIASTSTIIAGTDTSALTQDIQVKILDGTDTGSVVTFNNDYTQLHVGDVFYLRHTSNTLDATDYYSVSDPYRIPTLGFLTLLFVVLIFLFGGIQGVRGLLSLIASFFIIFYVLLPGILDGYPPLLVSLVIASLIIVVGSYVTHGFNKTTSAAVLGMIGTVVITGLIGYVAVHSAQLSGYNAEESIYLNFDTRGHIDLVGVLFSGIMIGLLGVLYDIAIGQAIAVEELFSVGGHLSRQEIYKRAIRIGREHIGALVNTLAIAYVGAALPLLLLVRNSATYGILYVINNELFSTEIIRILIGSIGLILAVPITTGIAIYLLKGANRSGIHSHSHTH